MSWRALVALMRSHPWGVLWFLAYFVLLGAELSGALGESASLGMYAWFLIMPVHMARSLEFDGGFLRPARPSESVSLAGLFTALGVAGFVLVAYHASWAAQTEPDGFLRTLVGFQWLLVAFMGALLIVIPRPANWVRLFNQQQAARLVASETALATARMQLLQSQMQPHFLFNALNTVTALLREDPKRGGEVLLRLKALFERTLATRHNSMTTVGAEVAFVRDQLAIEQERFHDRLRVSVDVDPALCDEPVPSFSLQPLAENALRHGIAQSMSGGTITVSVSRVSTKSHHQPGTLLLMVEDSGAGLPPRWKEGTGLTNLRERLRAEYGRRATLTIETTGDGTRAVIAIAPAPWRRLVRSGESAEAEASASCWLGSDARTSDLGPRT